MSLFKAIFFHMRKGEWGACSFKREVSSKKFSHLRFLGLQVARSQDLFKRLHLKTDFKRVVASNAFLAITFGCVLTNCSFLGIHDQSFDCPAQDGMKCTSTTDVNKSVDGNDALPEKGKEFISCKQCSKKGEGELVASKNLKSQLLLTNHTPKPSTSLWDASLKKFVSYEEDPESNEDMIS